MLSMTDVAILKNYNFTNDELAANGQNRQTNNELLCVKLSSYGTPLGLSTVKRVDITAWNLFKAFFGFGKLDNLDFHLTSVANYLSKKNVTKIDSDSEEYATIHSIATRMLTYQKTPGKVPALWEELATDTQKFRVQMGKTIYKYLDNRFDCQISRNRFLPLTPKTTVGHLSALVKLLEEQPYHSTKKGLGVEGKRWGGYYGSKYRSWYHTVPSSETREDKDFKDVFFRVVTSRKYEDVYFPHHFGSHYGSYSYRF